MERIPKTGEIYKDGANKVYQIVTVAIHAETGERMAVYQAMFGEFRIYAKEVQKFMSEHEQYFLNANIELAEQGKSKEHAISKENHPDAGVRAEFRPRTQSPAESRRALRQNVSESSGEGAYYYEKRRRQMEEREQRRELFRKSERNESATEELRANPCLIKFLEADTYEEKFHVLNEIQNDITDRLIDDIAVVLDVVIPEGALNDRFHQLRNIILTRQKYETNRFR